MLNARPFNSVLVANRGEIAVRVLDEARDKGMRAIAVFSEADKGAMHMLAGNEAVCIGPAAAAQSYLSADAILDAARKTGAEAIHPGYGFLSENADFARAVIDAGLVWIGPPPEAIEAMGDKARAKQLMIDAGVPTLPGWQGEDQSDTNLTVQAETVGYPLLIKAVAGGGGRGMRIVRKADEFADALASARREAKSAFGDDAVLLERFIERGRHVEIQIFADTHGNVVHLNERDCSTQRRRQKVIEEAPSLAVDEGLRGRMGADAVAAAKAVDYVGAGTVEFLLDDDGNYFFLEMNTRLQVEHTVTEEITDTNLVQWQLTVAAGKPLPITDQDEASKIFAHSIELRLYAEDPFNGFTPQSGRVVQFEPFGGVKGVRVDTGVCSHHTITTNYDPMVAKLIGSGKTREQAINRLRRHLIEAPLLGVTTNRDFLIQILNDARFQAGAVRTSDLDAWAETQTGPFERADVPFEAIALAVAVLTHADHHTPLRSASVSTFGVDLMVDGEAMSVVVEQTPKGVVVSAGEQRCTVECLLTVFGSRSNFVNAYIDGVSCEWPAAKLDNGCLHIAHPDRMVFIEEASPWSDASVSDPSKIAAPVSGAVVAVNVKPGDVVKAGDVVAVMEAMKMEMRLTAEADGKIAAVHAAEGGQASGGFVLIEIDLQSED